MMVAAQNLTLAEYVILKQIKENGDWEIDKLEELEHFDWENYNSLLALNLVIVSWNNPKVVHASPEVDRVLAQCRFILGINCEMHF